MRRRQVGVGAVKDLKRGQEKYKEKGSSIQDNLVEELSRNLDQFKSKLEQFAAKHKKAIKRDPEFREHFQDMCATIGVDPLASSKGFWSEMLGMGTFYYEIAVQAVEVLLATAQLNGGVMTVGELQQRLNRARSKSQPEVSCDDIVRAIKSLHVLGKGCGIIPSGKKKAEHMVFCVPEELSLDNTKVLQHVAQSGSFYVTVDVMCNALGWTTQRANSVIEKLIRDGIVWVDEGSKGATLYWFPSLFLASGGVKY